MTTKTVDLRSMSTKIFAVLFATTLLMHLLSRVRKFGSRPTVLVYLICLDLCQIWKHTLTSKIWMNTLSFLSSLFLKSNNYYVILKLHIKTTSNNFLIVQFFR